MLNNIYILVFGLIVGFQSGKILNETKYIEIDNKITKEMKRRPTKYKDMFSFGYNVGLIKCSGIVYDVKKGK